jgi:hypothetical protein
MIIFCKMDSVLNQAQGVNIKTVYAYLAWITFYSIILQINAKLMDVAHIIIDNVLHVYKDILSI